MENTDMNKQMAVNATIKVLRLFETKLCEYGVMLALNDKEKRVLEQQVAHLIYNEFLGNATLHAVAYQARLVGGKTPSDWMPIDEEIYKNLATREGWEVRALAPL